MTLYHVLAGGMLALIALIHSVLGEREIVRPLLADRRWEVGLPRRGVERVIRFAWHLTTVAWLALAATAFGLDAGLALLGTAAISGAVVVVALPAHLAWPMFLTAALWAGIATGVLDSGWLAAIALLAVSVAVVAAIVHLVWAAGFARATVRAAVPTKPDGEPLIAPGRAATIAVAAALGTFAAALTVLVVEPSSVPAQVLVGGAALVLLLRAIGDGRYVGFTKRVQNTTFARRDDALYTPIVVVLLLGAVAGFAV